MSSDICEGCGRLTTYQDRLCRFCRNPRYQHNRQRCAEYIGRKTRPTATERDYELMSPEAIEEEDDYLRRTRRPGVDEED
jgi:predicted amidophosphoribosyltransferase